MKAREQDALALLDGAESVPSPIRSCLKSSLQAFELFLESPEAGDIREIRVCDFLFEEAAARFGASLFAVTGTQLGELLFSVLPRARRFEAADAPAVITEIHAFFSFLKREAGLETADELLQVLGGNAAERLAELLSRSARARRKAPAKRRR